MIWNVAMVIGGMVMVGGLLMSVAEQAKTEARDARAVRAFFKGYTDSHQVSYIGRLAEGGWEIHVRSLDDENEPYSAVPTRLLLQLSDETRQTTPWTKIVVDPSGRPAQADAAQ